MTIARRLLLIGLTVAAGGGTTLIAQEGLAQSPAVARNYPVTSFDKVAAAGPNLVVVHVGGSPSVRAEGPADMLDRMEVVVEHGGLQIRPKREYRDHFDWSRLKRATFTVNAPRLTVAAQAGSGEMRVDRAEGDRFDASVAGSGSLDIAALRVRKARLSMAGSGNLTARGSAGEAEVSIAGSGTVHARGLDSRKASVSVAGSGDADLTADDTANVSIIGSGSAEIGGRAHCTVSRIGSGRARCNA